MNTSKGSWTLALLNCGCLAVEPTLLSADPPLRREFIQDSRPDIRQLLADTEEGIGMCMIVGAGELRMQAAKPEAFQGVQQIAVEPVWSAHPVGFCLLTHPPFQFVAYYDALRRMSVAQRSLDSTNWTITKLPSALGWDSHNYVTMALDRDAVLHVSGNMHCVPR